jgi:hypothetical protein
MLQAAKARLGLAPDQPCIVILDVWVVHRSQRFRDFIAHNYPYIKLQYRVRGRRQLMGAAAQHARQLALPSAAMGRASQRQHRSGRVLRAVARRRSVHAAVAARRSAADQSLLSSTLCMTTV